MVTVVVTGSPMVLSRGRCVPGPGEDEQPQRRTRRLPAPKCTRRRAPPPGQPRATSESGAAGRRSADRPGTVRAGARRGAPARASDVRAARLSGHSSQRTGCVTSGTVHSRTPPGRSTLAHSREHGAAGRARTQARSPRPPRPRLPCRERQRAPAGLEPDPADAPAPGPPSAASRSIVRRDVTAGHPVADAPPGAVASSPLPQPRSSSSPPGRSGSPTAPVSRASRPASGPLGCVLGWPAGRLRVEQRSHPVRVPVRPRSRRGVAPDGSATDGCPSLPPRQPGSWPASSRASPRSAVPPRQRPPAGRPPPSARCPLS